MLALSLYSCKKDSLTAETPDSGTRNGQRSSNNFTVVDGRLAFPTQESFQEAMSELNSMDDSLHHDWYSTITGFNSLAAFYEEADANAENGISPSADSLIDAHQLLDIPDHAFASVLSKDGMIQVGDTVYIINQNQDTLYTVSSSEVNIISSKNWSNPVVHTQLLRAASCNWFAENRDFLQADNGNNFPTHNGRPTRLRVSKWNAWYGVYSTAGVRAKIEKKTMFLGWLANTRIQYVEYTSGYLGEARYATLPTSPISQSPALYYGSNLLSKQITHAWFVGVTGVSAPILCYYNGNYPFNGYVNYAGAIKHWVWDN